MLDIWRSEERGSARLPWLLSRHTFSFGNFYDPDRMGISVLRVINDDQVTPGGGFPSHSHQDMEIISYVKKGSIEHKDSMGNRSILPAGEFQLMSAGTGVTHSEYNPSATESLEFLQIWIQPGQLGVDPGYQQKAFERLEGLQLVLSPDGRLGSLQLNQDALLYRLILSADASLDHAHQPERPLFVHVVSGALGVDGKRLGEGDGAAVRGVDVTAFTGVTDAEALVFDLP